MSRPGTQINGDTARDRVVSLVDQHRQLEAALLKGIEAQTDAWLAERNRYRKLIGDIRYAVTANHMSSGGAVVQVRRLLAEFSGVVQVTPGVDGVGESAVPVRLVPNGGRRPGQPDDWYGQPGWMTPEPPLTHDYDQFGVQIEYPGMLSGTFSYTALSAKDGVL